MEINKRCISAFSQNGPFVALATKSKLFDPTFSLTSELILVNYMTGHTYPAITTELKFCKIMWCEFQDKNYLIAGHENGYISIYDRQDDGLVLLKTKQCLQDDISAIDFLSSKYVLVAASAKGKIIFWTLSNLEKEFTLDVPLPLNISAISCNPKVVKIMCVGTADGIIKVIDIKKLSVILSLTSKEFTEVKQLEWDPNNNTRLRVMSEKGHISVFDLSNDSVIKLCNHQEPLIGSKANTFVSKNLLETNGIRIQIPESFECSISNRDPVVALSNNNGITQIISIPFFKKQIAFCRIRNYVLTKNENYKIVIENNYEATENNEFYDDLIKKINAEEPLDNQLIGEYLLENYQKAPTESTDANIAVDLEDKLTVELVKNNFDNLKDSKAQIDLSVLDILRTNDVTQLSKVTEFPVVLVLCKILNDFSAIRRIKNPRILASLMMYHNITAFSLLNSSKEGRVLKSIFTKSFGEYIDNKSSQTGCYLKKMKDNEALLTKTLPFISSPLKSKILSEYFWYQVFMGNFEKVKDLQVLDSDVQFYLQRIGNDSIIDQMKSLDVKEAKSTFNGSMQQGKKPEMSYNASSSFSANDSMKSVKQMPLYAGKMGGQLGSYQSNTSIPTPLFKSQVSTANATTQPNSNFSQPSIPTLSRNTYSQANTNMQSNNYPQPSMSASNSYTQSNTAYPQPSTPQTPNMQRSAVPTRLATPTSLSGSPAMSSIASAQGYKCAPKSPFSGAIPMNPLRNNPSFSTPVSNTGVPQPSMPTKPFSTSPAPQELQPGAQNLAANNKDRFNIENPDLVISKFEQLIGNVRQKAAANNSLILKQRKTQFLNALNGFDSLDKSKIPHTVLYAIELVIKRLEAGGNNLKSDLSILVEGYSDVVWLKAFVELVKMVN